jgi:arylsulfatase A-like enzyme
MMIRSSEVRPAAGEVGEPGTRQETIGPFLTTLWVGLLAGWLELGLVLAQRAVNPHVSIDTLRTNRHSVWMIPVSNVLIFGAVGLSIAVLAKFHRGCARWTALRLSVALTLWTLLLTVEGLYAGAGLILALGLAASTGPWLERRVLGIGRIVRISLPALGAGLIVLTGLTYERVTSAEHRALACRPPAKPGAPNVLLIVLDDVRAASLSLYGHPRSTTPNLERLARRGVVFTEARSTAPWTLPSHASLMTGRWPHELSVGPDLPLDGTFPTLAEVLGREGYATAGFVANTLYCNARFGVGRGFAHYEDSYENQHVSLFETIRSSGLGRRILQVVGYPVSGGIGVTSVRKTAAMLNRDVLGWLGEQPAGQPFFVFINYYDAHSPYVFPGDPDLRFGLAALPLADHRAIDKRFWDYVAGRPTPAEFSTQQIISEGYGLFQDSYESCIAYLDQQVGLLLDDIDRRGLLENTLVIITSDHGEQFGERGLMGHGVSLYRREVHVPLLVIPPSRSSPGRFVNQPVSNREVPATVAEWVHLGTRNPFPGRPLTRFVTESSARIPAVTPVLCEVQHITTNLPVAEIPSTVGSLSSLVTQDRVYIRSARGREELYDRVHDDLEAIDLAGHPQSQGDLQRFRKELCRLCSDGSPRARERRGAFVREALMEISAPPVSGPTSARAETPRHRRLRIENRGVSPRFRRALRGGRGRCRSGPAGSGGRRASAAGRRWSR